MLSKVKRNTSASPTLLYAYLITWYRVESSDESRYHVSLLKSTTVLQKSGLANMANDYKSFLAAEILSESKIVSYRILSRELKVHCNTAKKYVKLSHCCQLN